METLLLPATTENITAAARLIQRGEVVGFPTETVYGLGADGMNAEAVQKIFAAKERPADNPLILHIAEREELSAIVKEVTPVALALTRAFWPGPLTVLLPAKPHIPQAVHPGLDTVTVRMPSHPIANVLIRLAGCPLAAPSANRSGRPSPTCAKDVMADMEGRIPMILDGGVCGVGVESTVVDCTGSVPKILRPGGVTPEMIESVWGNVEVDETALTPLAEGAVAASPGMRHRHYAPKARLLVVEGPLEPQLKRMAARYDEETAKGGMPVLVLAKSWIPCVGRRRCLPWGDVGDSAAMAESLFSLLREIDHIHATLGICQGIEPHGLGLAVMNRLLRAAAHNVEYV